MSQSKHILIVDDEVPVTLVLSDALEKLGDAYVVDTANDGQEALAKIQQGNWELLITDYKMPGLDGLTLAQAVQQFSPDTHIILITAYGDDLVRQTVEQLDLDGYLDKPFTIAQVRDMVIQTMHDQADESLPKRVLVMEDTDDLRRLYTRALERAGYEVYAAATLEEARDLLLQHRFAAFLCDVHIGRERGTDLLREQYDKLRQCGTQIIMISADPHYRAMTEELGIEFYMEKPVDIVPLVTLIDRLTVHSEADTDAC